jgi:diguanylate cyclase
MSAGSNNPLDVIAVEDSADDAFLLKRQLEKAGFGVTLERVDTEAALVGALHRKHWDVVFSDSSMPQFDGMRALKIVREHDRDLPFIIVSGTIDEERAVQLLKTGAQDYVVKGNTQRLIPAVERELREAKVRREHRLAREHVERLAYYNPLTQLPNRHRLIEELEQQCKQAAPLALFALRLINLREINEILGYNNGDQLIREVAGRLQQHLTSEKDGLYHLQGNEFAVLRPESDKVKAQAMAREILQILGPSHVVAGLRIHVGVCIGIVLSQGDSADAVTLLQSADSAAALAKHEETGFAWYEPKQDSTRASRLALVADLHDAFGTEQLSLVFQPKIECSTGAITGSEALLRWRHPKQGLIPPDVFVAMAERYGLIDQLTRHVVMRVVELTRSSRRQALPVAINLSVKNLLDAPLIAEILKAQTNDSEAGRGIEIEITETALMRDQDRALGVLHGLHDAGIKIYLDDFGTGFSSLGYLGKLPVDAIKIDKSFVLDLTRKAEADTIVRSTIGLAHNLGLKVVAEGVEDKETWERLKAYSCDEGQGYYFSKPVPSDQFDAWILTKQKF